MKIRTILLFLLFCAWLPLLINGDREKPVSAYSSLPNLGQQDIKAQPEPTAIPFIEADERLTDPQQIVNWLSRLSQVRSERLYSTDGWWHIVERQSIRAGNLSGLSQAWWVNYHRGQTCPEGMQLSFSGGETEPFMALILVLRDSTLAAGKQEARFETSQKRNVIEINEQSCGDGAYSGFNGLERALTLLSNTNQFISAELYGENGLWVVKLITSDGIQQTETLTFDPLSGEMVREQTQLYQATDHMLLGESESQFSYEYFNVLPAEIEVQFAGVQGK